VRCHGSGCVNNKEGNVIIDKEEIMKRWSEYTKERYQDEREEIDLEDNQESPCILTKEVEEAIKSMKNGKTPGPDGVTKEEMEVLGDFGIGIITNLLNDIYNTGHIPDDLLKAVFIALPKKSGAECEDFRTISIMNHATKILLHIIMKRIRNKIKHEVSEEP
jgi:hypothetical protein